MSLHEELEDAIKNEDGNQFEALFTKYNIEELLPQIKDKLHSIALFGTLSTLNRILELPEIVEHLRDEQAGWNFLETALRSAPSIFVFRLLELDFMAMYVRKDPVKALNRVARNIKDTAPQIFDAVVALAATDFLPIEDWLIEKDGDKQAYCQAWLTAHVNYNTHILFKLLSYPKVFALIDHIDEKDNGVFSQHSSGTHDIAVKFIPHYFAELERRKTQHSKESDKVSRFDVGGREAELGVLMLKHLLRTYPQRVDILRIIEIGRQVREPKKNIFQSAYNKFLTAPTPSADGVFLDRIKTLLAIPSVRRKAKAVLAELLETELTSRGSVTPLVPELADLLQKELGGPQQGIALCL